VELHDGLQETEAQWMEHSEAWRLAHLDLAPSAYLRQEAIAGAEPPSGLSAGERRSWTSLPYLTVEMLVILAVVAMVVIGAASR